MNEIKKCLLGSQHQKMIVELQGIIKNVDRQVIGPSLGKMCLPLLVETF